MKAFSARFAYIGVALAMAQPVFAQDAAVAGASPPPPGDERDIVVTSDREKKEKAVRDLARQVTGRLPSGKPIARFHRPLCLAVAGVNRQFVDGFAGRILANAKLADVPIATGNCKANALVIFTGDSRKELEQARKKNRWIFGNLGQAALKMMLESRDPAFAWRATQIVGTDGMRVAYDDRELPQNRTIEMAGRLKEPYMLNVSGAVVMIDRDAADGMTAQQLADYATLRLLAPTGEILEQVPGAPDTIMTLFRDRENAPPGLTDFDIAVLHGVYAIGGNIPASALYGEVLGRVMKGQ